MRVILIGGGKTVYFLARQFISKGYNVTLINRSADEAKNLSRQIKAVVVLGDGSDPAVLEEAGARRADVVLALTGRDQDNLVACQLAKQMYSVPRTVALVNDPENEEVFHQLGVTVAFSATRIIATLIEEQTGFEEITNLVPMAEGKIVFTEVAVGEDAPALGKTLQTLDLPEGVLIAGILRRGEVIVPRGTNRVQLDDRLIVLGQPETYGAALRALVGGEG
ncbi:MAG: TrkA family potassium uptake protein [Caldilineaceae bacterium]|nr:TrkA family potassium uptake protein [Caldilineaceae bacterium]